MSRCNDYIDDYCSDCGQWLNKEEYKQGVCSICSTTTHVEYAHPIRNAKNAWLAMKDRVKKAQAEPEIIEPNVRRLKIK